MSYKFVDDVTMADTAFKIEAENLEELFIDGAKATFESMVDLKAVKQKKIRNIKLESDTVEQLFFDWIGELIYLKDADYLLFSKFEIDIKQDGKWSLEATVYGDKIHVNKQSMRVDVKAITYHHFKVEEENGKWQAFVVLDI